MSPDTPAERKRRQRARERGELPPSEPLLCAACGSPHRGRHTPLCRACWLALTPDGRADRLRRVVNAQKRRKRDHM